MTTKLFELRDRGTFLPVICIKLDPSKEEERYLLAMTGYGLQPKTQGEYILMGRLRDGNLKCCPEEQDGYPGVRTLWVAHQHIQKHFDELTTGDVIDVEFILGETTEAKKSQRIEDWPTVLRNIAEEK